MSRSVSTRPAQRSSSNDDGLVFQIGGKAFGPEFTPDAAGLVAAAGWGILNAAHFSRAFRDAYGLTPAEYRRLHLEAK